MSPTVKWTMKAAQSVKKQHLEIETASWRSPAGDGDQDGGRGKTKGGRREDRVGKSGEKPHTQKQNQTSHASREASVELRNSMGKPSAYPGQLVHNSWGGGYKPGKED